MEILILEWKVHRGIIREDALPLQKEIQRTTCTDSGEMKIYPDDVERRDFNGLCQTKKEQLVRIV